MASVTCQRCKTEYAVIGCDECKTLVCTNCSSTCQSCGTSICIEHTHLTKGGRKLCGRCSAERNARRQALKEKYSAGAAAGAADIPESKTATATSLPLIATPKTPTDASSPFAANKGARFSQIGGDAPLIPIRTPEPEIDEDADAGPDQEDRELNIDPEEASKIRKAHEADFASKGRLELPPMDENRPVLSLSGYQPPSRKRVFAAFVFFGIGMLYFYSSTPYFKDTLFPFGATEVQFQKGQIAQIQTTNKIRNTSNLQQFDILKQAPTFFMAWLIVGSYLLGIVILVIGIIRSSYWSYIAKRNLEASRNLDIDNNKLQKL